MEWRLLIHLDLPDKERVTRALGNIKNFLKEIPADEAAVCLVANSAGVPHFKKSEAGDYEEKIQDLADKGVRFLICNNTLSHMKIDRSELVAACEVVPAGIVELVRLQQEGFAYVKP